MKKFFRKLARKAFPTAYPVLEAISREEGDPERPLFSRLVKLEAQNKELRTQVADLQSQLAEIRVENRSVAELYELVFSRIRADLPLVPTAAVSHAQPTDSSQPAETSQTAS